jgi:ABC-type transport system substrate-binding protein
MRASPVQGPPNVVGYLLEEAKAALAEAGWTDIDTTETRPPRRALTGPLRVLRQRTPAPGRIVLVVSGERPA